MNMERSINALVIPKDQHAISACNLHDSLAAFLLTTPTCYIRMMWRSKSAINQYVPVAQPDRVFDYESKGRGFESLRARHERHRFPPRGRYVFLLYGRVWYYGFKVYYIMMRMSSSYWTLPTLTIINI